MSQATHSDGLWDSFPGGYARDRAAAIAIAIELGLHDEGQGDEPAPTKVPVDLVEWSVMAGVQAHVVRNGHRFAAVINPAGTRWGVLGVCTPETSSSATSSEARAEEVLANHAHELLGVFDDFGYSLMVAERFILRAPVPTESCACEELGIAGLELPPTSTQPSVLGRVQRALLEAGFYPPDLHLEESPLGRVSGYIVSGRFAHQSQIERQAWFSDLVREALGHDHDRVGVVLTMTRAEAE